MGADIVDSFHNDYASVEDFEQKTGIQLPEDIAAMLTPSTVIAAKTLTLADILMSQIYNPHIYPSLPLTAHHTS